MAPSRQDFQNREFESASKRKVGRREGVRPGVDFGHRSKQNLRFSIHLWAHRTESCSRGDVTLEFKIVLFFVSYMIVPFRESAENCSFAASFNYII